MKLNTAEKNYDQAKIYIFVLVIATAVGAVVLPVTHSGYCFIGLINLFSTRCILWGLDYHFTKQK